MTVPIRDAATVLVLRDAPALEVLLLRRSTEVVFAGGAHVFPGGAIDPDDGPEPELASRTAAVRETLEEAGILLSSPPVDDPGRVAAARASLAAGSAFTDVLAGAGAVAATGDLRPFGRWVTPPGGPRRFDTRFFLAPSPPGAVATPDGFEVVEASWWRPAAALRAAELGEIELILPTQRSLEALVPFASATEALAAERGAA